MGVYGIKLLTVFAATQLAQDDMCKWHTIRQNPTNSDSSNERAKYQPKVHASPQPPWSLKQRKREPCAALTQEELIRDEEA